MPTDRVEKERREVSAADEPITVVSACQADFEATST